jgi:hypothetical protein
MKATVTIWNDEEKTVEDIEIDVELQYWSDYGTTNYWFWLEGKCPYDGENLSFAFVWDGVLSKRLEEEIDKISQDFETYTNEEIKHFLARISTVIKYYDEFPTETERAGNCVHFAPTEYYEFEDEDEPYISEVENGVATVDINDVIQELIDEMKG